MSPKSFLTLVVLAAAAVLVAIIMLVIEQSSTESQSAGGDPMFPDFVDRIDDLGRITIETPRYSIDLELRDGEWVSVGFGDYPADPEPLVQIVTSMAGMTTVESKTENPDWYRYINVGGPDDEEAPGVRVSAFASNGDELADAIFGLVSSSIGFSRVGGSFVRRTDEAQAWLVEGILPTPNFIQDWFDPLFSIPGPEVAKVTILSGGVEIMAAEKVDFNTGDYEFTFISPDVAPVGSTANDSGIRGLTQGIVSTIFDEARARDTVNFEGDYRTLRFVTINGLELEVSLGEADGEVWVTYTATAVEGSEATADALSIASRTNNWAFKVPSFRIVALSRPFEDLFEPPPEEAADPDPAVPPGLLAPAP